MSLFCMANSYSHLVATQQCISSFVPFLSTPAEADVCGWPWDSVELTANALMFPQPSSCFSLASRATPHSLPRLLPRGSVFTFFPLHRQIEVSPLFQHIPWSSLTENCYRKLFSWFLLSPPCPAQHHWDEMLRFVTVCVFVAFLAL